MVGAGRDTGLQANYDFLHSSNPTEQMILDAGMARAFSINQLGALDLSAPGPMTEGGGFSDHFFGRLDNAWESLKSTGALIRDASGFGDEGSFTRTWTALGEASIRSNKFIGSVVAGQIPFNDLLFPEIAQYRRDVASEFVTSIADRYTLAYKDGGWSAVAGEGVGDLFVLGVEALATKGAGRVVSSLSRLDRLFKLDLDTSNQSIYKTFSSGDDFRYTGGPQYSLDEAAQMASDHGIDMRMFKLKYESGNQYDWGFVSQYFDPKTLEPFGVYRATDGRIELTLFDKGLRNQQDIIETISHELNHVRGYFKLGKMSSEASAETAAEAARPFVKRNN